MSKSAAKGATLSVKNTTWQVIKYLGDFDFPQPPVDMVDVTTHDSVNNTEEMLPTIFKSTKVSVPLKWDDSETVHTFLATSNGTVQAFKYTGAGHATAFAFNAIISVSFKNPVKGVKEATLELTISDGSTPA